MWLNTLMKNYRHFAPRTVIGALMVNCLILRSDWKADFIIHSSGDSILCQCLKWHFRYGGAYWYFLLWTLHYFMAVSHKDWELPNSRIRYWPRSRFSHPDRSHFAVKKLQTTIQNYGLSCSKNISFMEVPKSKGDEQTLAELSSAHHRSEAKCQLR